MALRWGRRFSPVLQSRGHSLPGSPGIPTEGWPWSALEGGCMFVARRVARSEERAYPPAEPPGGSLDPKRTACVFPHMCQV